MPTTKLKVYPPVWRCTYCGAAPKRKGALGMEHIIAKGLDGALILPRASCDLCGEKTKKIEGACLRQMFREARAHLKIPTKPRRPEQRPSELRIGFTDDTGKRNWLDIPIEAHPFAFSMPILPVTGILEDKPPDKRIQIDRLWTNLGPRFRQKLHDIGADSAFTLIPIGAFCQMLAKIGHAYAIAEIGFERFTPLLVDLILDRDECGQNPSPTRC